MHAAVLDVTDESAARQWIEGCDAVAPLELVFSNAGIGTGVESEANIRRTFATNVNGNLNIVLPLLERFRAAPEGRARRQIVVTASIAGYASFLVPVVVHMFLVLAEVSAFPCKGLCRLFASDLTRLGCPDCLKEGLRAGLFEFGLPLGEPLLLGFRILLVDEEILGKHTEVLHGVIVVESSFCERGGGDLAHAYLHQKASPIAIDILSFWFQPRKDK